MNFRKKAEDVSLSSLSESTRTFLDVKPFTTSQGDYEEDLSAESLLQDKDLIPREKQKRGGVKMEE